MSGGRVPAQGGWGRALGVGALGGLFLNCSLPEVTGGSVGLAAVDCACATELLEWKECSVNSLP